MKYGIRYCPCRPLREKRVEQLLEAVVGADARLHHLESTPSSVCSGAIFR